MKNMLFVIFLLPVLSFGQAVDIVDMNDLEEREGLFYKHGNDKPFTGFGVSFFHANSKYMEGNYKNGNKEGLWTEWHPNG